MRNAIAYLVSFSHTVDKPIVPKRNLTWFFFRDFIPVSSPRPIHDAPQLTDFSSKPAATAAAHYFELLTFHSAIVR